MRHPWRATARAAVRTSAATMAVVLPAFWSMMQLRTWLAVPVDAVVFAVMLALALPRGLARLRPGELPAALTALVAGTAVAVGCGMLLDHAGWHRTLGAAAFTAGVAIPVWARRFGTDGAPLGRWRRCRSWRSWSTRCRTVAPANQTTAGQAGARLGFGSARRLADAIGEARALSRKLLAQPQDGRIQDTGAVPDLASLVREAGPGSRSAGVVRSRGIEGPHDPHPDG
ncbi:hypothetical protein ACU635_26080 [[Actinomadura] parvosata]|uniref:hypothetical protein n=1 Tax=[Actinomadura] parvosata TaxID=1955412 RepID=UPI00406CBA25